MVETARVKGLVSAVGDAPAPPQSMRLRWIGAGIGSLSLHFAVVALAWAHLGVDVNDGDLGANAIEVAVEMEAPQSANDDLPPGPGSEASKAAAEVAEQKGEIRVSEQPTAVDETRDAAADPTSEKRETPRDEEAPVKTEASRAQSDSEATARKSLDDKATVSTVVKAPHPGIGKDPQIITASWGRRITAYLELHKRFPEGRNRTGKVGISFVVDRRGKLVSVAVEKSSGDSSYDAAAISMIQRSDPVPPAPGELEGAEFAFSLDVNFDISERKRRS
ncbi:MAG: TonB family protein [Alphaproteobacteria bacterium]|nr:TonB family protein [Alphaproteobacteria bacterium]